MERLLEVAFPKKRIANVYVYDNDVSLSTFMNKKWMVGELANESQVFQAGELGCDLVELLNTEILFGYDLLITIPYDGEELCQPMLKWFYWLYAHFGLRTIIVCPQQSQIIIARENNFPDELLFYCDKFVDYPTGREMLVRGIDGHFYICQNRSLQ